MECRKIDKGIPPRLAMRLGRSRSLRVLSLVLEGGKEVSFLPAYVAYARGRFPRGTPCFYALGKDLITGRPCKVFSRRFCEGFFLVTW